MFVTQRHGSTGTAGLLRTFGRIGALCALMLREHTGLLAKCKLVDPLGKRELVHTAEIIFAGLLFTSLGNGAWCEDAKQFPRHHHVAAPSMWALLLFMSVFLLLLLLFLLRKESFQQAI